MKSRLSLEPAGIDLTVRGAVSFRYETEYALANLHARDFRALSVRTPVSLASPPLQTLPATLRNCGVDTEIIEMREPEITRLVEGLRATGVTP